MSQDRINQDAQAFAALKAVMKILGELQQEAQKRIIDTCTAFYDLGDEG